MPPIQPQPLPGHALLSRYAREGAYTDCYVAEIDGAVTFARYVEAFYTTPLFKLERLILKFAVSLPSNDAEARQLAEGAGDSFAAWKVESRSADQLLLCDLYGNTRSWLMAERAADAGPKCTRLYFGSAVVPRAMRKPSFGLLRGIHVLYSKALLAAACRRIG